jgi:hypothetical protein
MADLWSTFQTYLSKIAISFICPLATRQPVDRRGGTCSKSSTACSIFPFITDGFYEKLKMKSFKKIHYYKISISGVVIRSILPTTEQAFHQTKLNLEFH